MPELRRDPVTGRWVIISPERGQRPNDFQIERAIATGSATCPFCAGHEGQTPPEVLAVRPGGGAPDTPGWDIRVVPNKYPALTRGEDRQRGDSQGGDAQGVDAQRGDSIRGGDPDRAGHVLFQRVAGVGAHEVIIETSDHGASLATMGEEAIARVLWACQQRIRVLKSDPRLRHVLLFKNHGAAAGATLEHPHAQLIALPLVPDLVREEIEGARSHHAATGRCLFCDIVARERASAIRLVHEDAEAVALMPYAARFPFETWLLPRIHGARFEDASSSVLAGVAASLRVVLRRMDAALARPAFNLVLHSAPFGEPVDQLYHWHVEVLPKLTRTAGFEWGTGCAINPTPPEEAAEVLRRP
ncbi:MAG: DUF4931 domain-containing protein [Vicinamibacterales bacterium]